MPDGRPLVSVIIPTYNRRESLLRTLDSLAHQTYPAEQFEVIVVDDGRSLPEVAFAMPRPGSACRILHQEHSGATMARNLGAAHALGETLVFVDDDIELGRESLALLVSVLEARPEDIVLGSLYMPEGTPPATVYSRVMQRHEPNQERIHQSQTSEVPCTECMTGLLAVRREVFEQLGRFKDPTGGWPNWDDVDFGYRASLAGRLLIRCEAATAQHWDHASSSLEAACKRWYRAAHAAPRLFAAHPNLKGQIPMFHDKDPIVWRHDPPRLILRKVLRNAISSRPAQAIVRRLTVILEQHWPNAGLLRQLYHWQVSAYIRKGYRLALKEMSSP